MPTLTTQILLDFWNNGGGKNISLTDEIKDLFFLSLKLNIDLKMFYIPSKLNDADTPSRFSSDSNCSLSDSAWNLLEDAFGPHTFDLMAIPSNVRRSKHGGKLNFFSLFPFEESSGVNVFAQSLSFEENYYVFPPFLLVGPLIRFLRERCSRVTLVAPDVSPQKYWWPIINHLCTERLLIGKKGSNGIILFPSNNKLGWNSRPLP